MSGNKVTEELLIVSDGQLESSKWQPVVPFHGSIYNDLEKAIETELARNGDYVFLMELMKNGDKIKLSMYNKHLLLVLRITNQTSKESKKKK